jgi:hypothetical protein
MDLGFVMECTYWAHVQTPGDKIGAVGNSLCYEVSDGLPDQLDMHDLNFYIKDTVWVPIMQLLPLHYNLARFAMADPRTALTPFWSDSSDTNGIRDEPRLPLAVAIYVRLRTAPRGRPWRGGKFLGPVCSSDTVGDELTVPAHAQWTSTVQTLGQTLHFTGPSTRVYTLVPVVLSRHLTGDGPPTNAFQGEPITQVDVRRVLTTKRHRIP